MKVAVIGAGLAGTVAAVRLRELGHAVEIFERRHHIAGNCFDSLLNNIRVHNYGPHCFHTNNSEVWEFVNRYASFRELSICVYANTSRGLIPIPYNRKSAAITGELTPKQITELLFIDYSEKQWGVKWAELPRTITARVPLVRDSEDGRYHLDRWQGVPSAGYASWFESMLSGITVHLGCEDEAWRRYDWDYIVYTGSIDQFYSYSLGRLEYRSLRFQYQQSPVRREAQINECNKTNLWTRSFDHSHWSPTAPSDTVVAREFPCEFDGINERFYPKPFGGNSELYEEYRQLAKKEPRVMFIGRLGTYKYLDMDDVIAQVLARFDRF
jgi:UDP-galactopyranose mutase